MFCGGVSESIGLPLRQTNLFLMPKSRRKEFGTSCQEQLWLPTDMDIECIAIGRSIHIDRHTFINPSMQPANHVFIYAKPTKIACIYIYRYIYMYINIFAAYYTMQKKRCSERRLFFLLLSFLDLATRGAAAQSRLHCSAFLCLHHLYMQQR